MSGLAHASPVKAALPRVVLVGRLVLKSKSHGPRAAEFFSGVGGTLQSVPCFTQQPTRRLSVVLVGL